MAATPLTPPQPARRAPDRPTATQVRAARRAGPVPRRHAAAVQFDGSRAVSPARPRSQRGGLHRRLGRGEAAGRPSRCGMVLHLGASPSTEADAAIVAESVREYFRRRAQATRRQLQHLFRVGRYSLLIAHGVPGRGDRHRRIDRQPVQQGALRLADRGQPGHRGVGRAVATARDLPLRLVADPRRSQAVRPAGPDGRAHGQRQAGRVRDVDGTRA